MCQYGYGCVGTRIPGGSCFLADPDGEGGTSVELLESGWELSWSSCVKEATSLSTRTSTGVDMSAGMS